MHCWTKMFTKMRLVYQYLRVSYSRLSLSRLPSISSISLSRTKCLAPWNFSEEHCIAFFYFELLYLELFLISNKFWSPLNHFLSLFEHLNIRISFSNSWINSNLNQSKSFNRKWKRIICFLFSVSSKQKCQI